MLYKNTTPRKISLLLIPALIIVLALSACSTSKVTSKAKQAAKKTPYELYIEANNTAYNTMRTSKGAGVTLSVTVTGPAAGKSQPLSIAGSIKVNAPDTPSMEMAMNYDTKATGQSFPLSGYYKDGVTYSQIAPEMKIKKKGNMNQLQATMCFIQFPKSAIIKQKSTKTSDGTDLDFTIRGGALKDNSTMISSLRALETIFNYSSVKYDTQYNFKDVTVTAHVGTDGSLESYVLDAPFSITVKGQPLTGTMTMKVSDITYGHQDITAPNDLSSYKDISSASDTTP